MKKAKLIIIIPCLNEAQSLPLVLKSIPRKIENIRKIETIVIDDGSTDQTIKVAKKEKADYLIVHKRKEGLAKTFEDGLQKALEIGADIMVNIDGDNQYNPGEIPKLIKPILEGKADMVLGNRQIRELNHMPLPKKIGNLFGSWTIRKLTGAKIQDASTGLRASTKEVAQSFNLISYHTYTHETIIQAVNKNFEIVEIPIHFKKRRFGQSKLVKGIWPHIKTSGASIVRTILIYKAFKYFIFLGSGIMFLGLLGTTRFLWFYLGGQGSGHIQSLIFSSILISIGFTTVTIGILADLIGINRKLITKS